MKLEKVIAVRNSKTIYRDGSYVIKVFDEGYSKAVKLVMGEADRGSLRNIHGPVAGLIHVPDLYTVAIETALGGAMQNIVVEREEDGKAVIQYLKRRDGGRATILPLSSIRPYDLREAGSLQREPGFVGVADQLVKFDPKYRNVFSNLLGRVVVMDEGEILRDGTPRQVFSDVEFLKRHDLDVPQATELSYRLAATGIKLPGMPLGVEECVSMFRRYLAGEAR